MSEQVTTPANFEEALLRVVVAEHERDVAIGRLRTSEADRKASDELLGDAVALHAAAVDERNALREALERVKGLVERAMPFVVRSHMPDSCDAPGFHNCGEDICDHRQVCTCGAEQIAFEMRAALADPTPPVCPTCGDRWKKMRVTSADCSDPFHTPNTEQETEV